MPPSSRSEAFRPPGHLAPTTPLRRLVYCARLAVDLQTNSIERDLRRELARLQGRLLDVGCGNSPFRHLLDPRRTQYEGLDVEEAAHFGYTNPDVLHYDGRTMPFTDASFDAVLCTEVLEHVSDPADTIREMHRVLKPGGMLLVTIPWSARFHYQPFDYCRYTPSRLRQLFAQFADVSIRPRGTDLSSIASKIVAAFARNLLQLGSGGAGGALVIPLRLLAALLALPLLPPALLLGHCGLRCGLGSSDDPLGYTLVARK